MNSLLLSFNLIAEIQVLAMDLEQQHKWRRTSVHRRAVVRPLWIVVVSQIISLQQHRPA